MNINATGYVGKGVQFGSEFEKKIKPSKDTATQSGKNRVLLTELCIVEVQESSRVQKPAVEDEPMTIKSREFRGDTREFMAEMAASGLDIERPCHETCSHMKGRTGSDDVLV